MEARRAARTQQKLYYADIHLRAIADIESDDKQGDAIDCEARALAHRESCFMHMQGALNAFLVELYEQYSVVCPPCRDDLLHTAQQRFDDAGATSPELNHLVHLLNDPNSWLNVLSAAYSWAMGVDYQKANKALIARSAVDRDDANGLHTVDWGKASGRVLSELLRDMNDSLAGLREMNIEW